MNVIVSWIRLYQRDGAHRRMDNCQELSYVVPKLELSKKYHIMSYFCLSLFYLCTF